MQAKFHKQNIMWAPLLYLRAAVNLELQVSWRMFCSPPLTADTPVSISTKLRDKSGGQEMDGICLCPHIHCVPGPYSPKAIANGNHRHFSGYNLSQVEAGYTEACLFMEKTQWDRRLGDKGPSLPRVVEDFPEQR